MPDDAASTSLAFTTSLTDKHQTTIPAPVRAALSLGKRDKLRFVVRDGTVTVEKAEAEPLPDPVVGAFLQFLERDMTAAPRRLRPLTRERKERVDALVAGVEFDIDAPLGDWDET